MKPEGLVLGPPNANSASTLESLLCRQNQVQGLLQAPTLEAAEWQRLGIAVDDKHGPSLAS
jgi:hypothetical protein